MGVGSVNSLMKGGRERVCGIGITNIMDSRNNRSDHSRPLHHIFRSQIVQRYPPQQDYEDPFMHEEPPSHDIHHDIFESFVRENDIVESYNRPEDRCRHRDADLYDNLMASESDHNDVPSRNSSLSSRDNI